MSIRQHIADRLTDMLICPLCHGNLNILKDKIECKNCGNIYPVKNGIPVFTEYNTTSSEPQDIPPVSSMINLLNIFKADIFYVPGSSYAFANAVSSMNRTERFLIKLYAGLHPDMIRMLSAYHTTLCYIRKHFQPRAELADRYPIKTFISNFYPYLKAYKGLPFVSYFKMLEGEHFRKIDSSLFGRGSIEIGIWDGVTSNLHFRDNHIEFGTEYIERELMENQHQHSHILSANINSLPLKDKSFKSVFLVHIFDDLDFDISHALGEIKRILVPSGHVIFSSASGIYGKHQSLDKMKQVVNITEEGFKIYSGQRYNCNNILTPSELEDKLISQCLSMEYYKEFLSINYAWLWDIGMTIEMGTTMSPLKILRFIPPLYSLYLNFVTNTFYKLYLYEKSNAQKQGIHYFCIAKDQKTR